MIPTAMESDFIAVLFLTPSRAIAVGIGRSVYHTHILYVHMYNIMVVVT